MRLPLPAFDIADEVNRVLAQGKRLIVTAPPGAGKSTILPLTISKAFPEGKILMLEPRRVAARQVAERMAWLLGEPVGKTVGYRVRLESKVSGETRIEVLTEGILTRMLIDDPALEGVGVVIFDEFHERSLQSDEALALTRQAQALLRDDLRIVLMSATLDTAFLSAALQAPVVESEGKMYPVEIRRGKEADAATVAELVAHTVREAHGRESGDILAFLPGEGEINKPWRHPRLSALRDAHQRPAEGGHRPQRSRREESGPRHPHRRDLPYHRRRPRGRGRRLLQDPGGRCPERSQPS